MSAADTCESSEKQPQKLDIKLVRRLFGYAVEISNDFEALAAARHLGRLLRVAGMNPADIFDGLEQAEVAVEAATLLIAENTELRERLARYEQPGGRGPVRNGGTDWADADSDTQPPREWARWALRENAARRLYLNKFESGFLPVIADQVGALTPALAKMFDGVKASVNRRIGGRRS